jgi:cytosine/adenosine deaminase-related metal-dependent hydrolase
MTGSKSHAKQTPSKIAAGVVIAANARMDVWRPGYVIVRAGRIVEVGPGTGPAGEFAEEVHEPSAILMPGLVNAHAHSPSNLLKGTWSRLPLEIWRQHQRAGWREYSDEAIYVSAQLGMVEMIRTGCTSVLDHFYTGSSSTHMGALHALSAMTDAGMRGGLALSLSDRAYESTVGIDREAASDAAREEMARISRLEEAQTLTDFVDFAKAVRQRTDRVVPIIGPSAPHRCSDALLVKALQLAVEMDTPLHAHVCETKGQFLQGRKLFGCTVVEHLDKLGLLNERLAMAHCVWLTDADVERIARQGALAIHNPASNGKLGSGRMRFDELMRLGARVGLATDGATSNDNQNMFEAMRLAGLWHNRNDRDYRDWPSPEAILRAATSGNAQALGLAGELGSIEPGRLADLVLLTTDSPHFVPLNDAITQLVYCENGTSVTDVMIDGGWVLRNRKLLTIDETALYRRARAVREEMDQRVQEQYRRTAPLEPPLREAYLRTGQAPWTQ